MCLQANADLVLEQPEYGGPKGKNAQKPRFCARQGICPSARDGPLGRFNQNTAAQRCNGGSIYCNVRKISEHAIK